MTLPTEEVARILRVRTGTIRDRRSRARMGLTARKVGP